MFRYKVQEKELSTFNGTLILFKKKCVVYIQEKAFGLHIVKIDSVCILFEYVFRVVVVVFNHH